MTGEAAKSSDPALAQRATGFALYAGFYGVPASAFEQVFTWLGQRYRLSACSARRCKFPFTAERVSDGKLIRLPCKVIRAAFLAKPALGKLDVIDAQLLAALLTPIANPPDALEEG